MPAARPVSLTFNLETAAWAHPAREGAILLAIDEPSVGRMLMRVFAQTGLKVIWVGSLADGFNWFQRHHHDIALAFVDCHQSEAESREFCRQVRALRPELPVLLAGCHGSQHAVDELSAEGPTVFVPKPYLPTELAWQLKALVREAAV